MQKIIFVLLSIVATVTNAQSPLFYAYGNIQAVASVGGGEYNVTINNYNGGYKAYPDANYDASDIPTTPSDFVVWGSCARMVVASKVSNAPLVLRVTDVNGALASGDLNGSRILIGQEVRVGSYNLGFQGNIADGNAGTQACVSPFENSCAQNYYKSQVASALQSALAALTVVSPLSGAGTIASPLKIIEGTAAGQVLKWNGSAWGAGADDTGGGAFGTDLSFSGSASPFMLNSSSGTDVNFASGDGIALSSSPVELTISNAHALREEVFTATASQTTFMMGYTAPAPNTNKMPLKVTRNGVTLEYTASGPGLFQFTFSGATLTTYACETGDKIKVEYIQ